MRAGMVNEACEYEHSSARYYCLGILDNITSLNPYYVDLGKDVNERQRKYHKFLQDFDIEEEQYFDQLDSPCGNTEFIRRLVLENGHLFPRRRGRS